MAPIANMLVRLLVIACYIGLIGASPILAKTISLDIQQGKLGDVVPLTIRVDTIPNTVDAFGFDVVFDQRVLQYAGEYVRGALSNGFDFFKVNELKTGQVRVGGFTTRNQIDIGSSGPLVTLAFTVVNPGIATLTLANLMDDVATWSVLSTRLDVASSERSDTASDNNAPQVYDSQTGESGPFSSALPASGIPQPPTDPGSTIQPQQPAHEKEQPSAEPIYRQRQKSVPAYQAMSPATEPIFPPMPRNETQASPEWQKPRVGTAAKSTTKNNTPNRTVMSAQRYNSALSSQTTQPQTARDHRHRAEPSSASGLSLLNSLLSGTALLGVIVMLLLQRKELALQRKALHTITQEMKHASYASGQFERLFRRHTIDSLASAKLNALSMLLKVEMEKAQINKSKLALIPNEIVPFAEQEESIELDLNKIDAYLAAIEAELKKS